MGKLSIVVKLVGLNLKKLTLTLADYLQQKE